MKEYLPIGSVVILKEGEEPLMICGRQQIHLETNTVYDYASYYYPEGSISDEYTFFFDHDDIDKILFTGYITDKETAFVKLLNENPITMIKDLLPIGSVVLLKKEEEKKLMVMGIKATNVGGDEKEYDYSGILYPEGYVGDELIYAFNHGDIGEVFQRGYEDEERDAFIKELGGRFQY